MNTHMERTEHNICYVKHIYTLIQYTQTAYNPTTDTYMIYWFVFFCLLPAILETFRQQTKKDSS